MLSRSNVKKSRDLRFRDEAIVINISIMRQTWNWIDLPSALGCAGVYSVCVHDLRSSGSELEGNLKVNWDGFAHDPHQSRAAKLCPQSAECEIQLEEARPSAYEHHQVQAVRVLGTVAWMDQLRVSIIH